MQGIKSPTHSEFATFQVLANKEFVNLSKTILPLNSPTPASHNGLNLPGIIEEADSFRDKPTKFGDEAKREEKVVSSARIKTLSQNDIAMHGIGDVFDVDNEQQENESFKDKISAPSSSSSQYSNKSYSSQYQQGRKEDLKTFSNAPSTTPMYESTFKPPFSQTPFTPSARQTSSPRPFFKTKQHFEKSEHEMKIEIDAEKEGLLAELANMERQGLYKTVKQLTMADSLEEIQFQYDRAQSEINANQIVDFAKTAIKMGSGMVEMVMKKAGIKVIDGYHTNLCKDMTKFNRPLNRIYKKYWRRGGLSAEAELGLLFITPLAWTVIQNKIGSLSGSAGSASGTEHDSASNSMNANMPSSSSNNNFDTSVKHQFSQPVINSMKPPQMSALNIPSSWGGFNDASEQKPTNINNNLQQIKKKQVNNSVSLREQESDSEEENNSSDASSESEDRYKKRQSPPKRIITLKNNESKGIGGGPSSGLLNFKKKSATLNSAQKKKRAEIEGEILEI